MRLRLGSWGTAGGATVEMPAAAHTKNDEVKEASGALEMPTDLYNGMALVLLKNLQPGSGTSVQMAVFTPKPRLIKMNLISEQEEVVRLAARPGRSGGTWSSSRSAGSPVCSPR